MECAQCGTQLPAGAMFCGECGGAVTPEGGTIVRSMVPAPLTRPVAGPEQWAAGLPAGAVASAAAPGSCEQCGAALSPEDIFCGECGFVSRSAASLFGQREEPSPGARFLLQFSTGESVAVTGTGLIGRSPHPEPGEYFDQLVRILDTSRSVSKTHLEFGQEEGLLWIKDRFSGNGTVLRAPEAGALRCRPDRRYRVARGSRVELGDQFFIVS